MNTGLEYRQGGGVAGGEDGADVFAGEVCLGKGFIYRVKTLFDLGLQGINQLLLGEGAVDGYYLGILGEE